MRGRKPKERDAATAWLAEYMPSKRGYRAAGDLREEAEKRGFKWRTVIRAKYKLGIRSYRMDSQWVWHVG